MRPGSGQEFQAMGDKAPKDKAKAKKQTDTKKAVKPAAAKAEDKAGTK